MWIKKGDSEALLACWFLKTSATFPSSLVFLLQQHRNKHCLSTGRGDFFWPLCFKFTELHKNFSWNGALEGCSANPCPESALHTARGLVQ